MDPLLELDARDAAAWPTLLEDMLAGRRLGAVLRGAFDPAALEAFAAGLEDTAARRSRPIEMKHYGGLQFGRTVVVSPPDLQEYFAEGARLREDFARLGFAFEAEVTRALGPLSAGREVRAPRGPAGDLYGAATVRVVNPGSGIDLHCEKETLRFPGMAAHLAGVLDARTQLSFYTPLRVPEAGGTIRIYDASFDDPAVHAAMNRAERRSEATLRWIEARGFAEPEVRVGDLLLFDAGRFYHRVLAVRGARARWTMGGFLATSREGDALHYWS